MFWISGGMFPWWCAGIVQREDCVTMVVLSGGGGVACATSVQPVLPAVSGLMTVGADGRVAANVVVAVQQCDCVSVDAQLL